MTTTYSINLTDSEQTPAWMALCTTATPGAQDSGRVRYTVTTEQPEALEAALDADDSVIEYEAQEDAKDLWWSWHDRDSSRWSTTYADAKTRCAAWVDGTSDDGPTR